MKTVTPLVTVYASYKKQPFQAVRIFHNHFKKPSVGCHRNYGSVSGNMSSMRNKNQQRTTTQKFFKIF